MLLSQLFESDNNRIRLTLGDDMVSVPMNSDETRAPIKLRGFGGGAPATDTDALRFIDEFEGMTYANPLDHRARVFNDEAVITLYVGNHRKDFNDPDHIYIQDIRSIAKGGGSHAMQTLCELADKHGVTLTLYAKGYAHTSTEQLYRWYSSFGFTGEHKDFEGLDTGSDMERRPR